MRKLRLALLAACTVARFAYAEWQAVSVNSEPAAASGVEHRHIVLRESSAGVDATIDLALFSAKSATLRVLDNGGGSDRLSEAMAREKCVAGVNGGYFDTNFKPIGLRVIEGATASPLVRARLLTGVLCASARRIEIVRLGEFSLRRKLDAALECGPFLVDSGTRVSNLDNKRSARRTFAAAARGGMAVLGVASELTLAQLGEALANRSLANDFRIWRAMNLDGGSSSAFWLKRSDGSAVSVSEDKAVRDFVAVAPK